MPVPAATQAPAKQSGPVTYLQSTGPLSSGGTIEQGAHQAIVAVMSSTAQIQNFATDTLVVGTADSTQSIARSSQSRTRVRPTRRLVPVEAFPADGGALIHRLQPLANAGLRSASARARQSVLPSTPRVGAQSAIWVQKGVIGGSRPSVQIPATLLAQTAHGNIWIDNTIAASVQGSIARIAADFENAYVSDVAHFASPDYSSNAPALQPQYNACSSTGAKTGTTSAYITEPQDRRVNVLVVNSPALGGLGGYFSVANYMTQAALNCLNAGYESNEAPFIFVGWFGGNGSTYELQEDLVRSTAHELQHLINFVNHGILASGASSPSFNGYELTFVNEGLSMLAQDFALQAMYGTHGVNFDADDALQRATAYLDDPGNYSLSAFTGIESGSATPQYNCNGGCYGVAYLFQRYLRDRFGADAYTRAMEVSGAVGAANLQAITGESLGELQDDFALAMAANTMNVQSTDKRFNFGSLNLTQHYRDQFGSTIALPGVFATPVSGPSTTVQAALGGFAYVAVPSIPSSGMPVQVTDQASVGGFALVGGLAQH
jgi:hypothetical protein